MGVFQHTLTVTNGTAQSSCRARQDERLRLKTISIVKKKLENDDCFAR